MKTFQRWNFSWFYNMMYSNHLTHYIYCDICTIVTTSRAGNSCFLMTCINQEFCLIIPEKLIFFSLSSSCLWLHCITCRNAQPTPKSEDHHPRTLQGTLVLCLELAGSAWIMLAIWYSLSRFMDLVRGLTEAISSRLTFPSLMPARYISSINPNLANSSLE